MRTKLIAGAMTALASLGLAFGSVSPVSAAWESCPAGQFCAWDGKFAEGQRWTFAFSNYDPVGTCWDLNSTTGNNKWSSYKNGFGAPRWIYAYDARNCSDADGMYTMQYTELGNMAYENNSISSFKIWNSY